MADVKKLIGNRIKTLRQARGISQEKLAEKTSLNTKYISSIERGKANPTLDTFIKIADALKLGIPELFNIEYEPKELAQLIAGLISEGDSTKLQLAAKVLNAICR
ncbi:MAG: HTH-type transcriptional regulator SinR [Syntrophorhabdaceae bacterium PtaU1.Bin034]|jgi:transcriptional regulator with XRE-family HTH domain|nr:MAG: HTH-type transcriptional regulator SinR [Syntrophorhabdaceae bacterium PtaU1.Bin034]